MLKNTEGKEADTFEQEMEYRIANLEKEMTKAEFTINASYMDGMLAGYRYALTTHRECRKDGTI